jgi:hypothetical protein
MLNPVFRDPIHPGSQGQALTFLNPLILFGLAAAAIPVLLHLFNLRKLQRIEFSTLAFLKELQKTRIRRLKLRQLLLLFLRTLLIVLIVTAFSRPTIKTSAFGGVHAQARTSAVIIIDNAYSMTSTDEQGQLLKQAKEGASGILQLMKEGDDVSILRVSDASTSPANGTVMPTRDVSVAQAAIQTVEPSYRHGTLEEALRHAASLLSTSKNPNKEVYVFSDFKRGNLDNEPALRRTEGSVPGDVRFYFFPLGNKTRQNLGVTSVTIENALFGVGKPLSLKVRVNNWGDQDVRNDVVSVFLNGARVAEKSIDILAQNSSETTFGLMPTRTGYQDGSVEIQDDDLEYDNHRSFCVDIPAQMRMLLVGSQADLRFVRLALSAQPTEGESVIKLSTIAPDRLSTNEIDGADVILFANVKNLTSAQQLQIRTFVESGGGLMFFPGSGTDSASFRSVWADNLGIPPVSSVRKIQQRGNQTSSVIEFDRIDFRHPVFAGMFGEEQLKQESRQKDISSPSRSLESPAIHSYVQYLTNLHSIPIITLSDGSPFVMEQRLENGVIMVFGVSATTDWSDFPLKGLFVPLLHSAATYAAQRNAITPEVTAGNEVVLSFRNQGIEKVMVQNPMKVDIAGDVQRSTRGGTLHFRETSLPGIYSVRSGSTLLRKFVVTLDARESNTSRASSKEIDVMLGRLDIPVKSVETFQQRASAKEAIVQSRVGLELWKYFVATALLVALLESVISRTGRKETDHGERAASHAASNV